MEDLLQWDMSDSDSDEFFVKEEDLKNSVTEKILRNKFRDPFISSASEGEDKPKINWDEVFTTKPSKKKVRRIFVPCLMTSPQYLKKSALTEHQHYQCIKVLCAENLHVLEQEFIPRPTNEDYKVFEELKSIYEQEQKEYREWAKSLWTTSHFSRALRPKLIIEEVYEAFNKLKSHEMSDYPKNYKLEAYIPLDSGNNSFEMILEENLVDVDVSSLPIIDKVDLSKKFVIMKSCPLPEICNKHVCRFMLPNEKSVSILPLTAVHSELAQYALERGATCVAGEEALGCLMELDRPWDLAVAVHQAVDLDGEKINVLVLGDEFALNKESAQTRNYKGFKYLLEQELIEKASERLQNMEELKKNSNNETKINKKTELDESSDDEELGLCIDTDVTGVNEDTQCKHEEEILNEGRDDIIDDSIVGLDQCTCKGTTFERPAPRSFKKWRLTNRTTKDSFSVLIHCAHRLRDPEGELVLEPTPEYQLELGASEINEGRLRSLALALQLRKDAAVLHVRLNAGTGEVATVEHIPVETFKRRHGVCDVTGSVHSTLAHLQTLRPGSYVLRHQPGHGANALLYAASPDGAPLECQQGERSSDEELRMTTTPNISTDLLPYHKSRCLLPCAFTPHDYQVQKASKRARARARRRARARARHRMSPGAPSGSRSTPHASASAAVCGGSGQPRAGNKASSGGA